MVNKESLQHVEAYIILLLRKNELNKSILHFRTIEEKESQNLELLIKVNIVNKWIVEDRLTYCYVKPTETQIFLKGHQD
ncbi:hypothetical protein BTR23_24140 [Alkalihalophilus pseudofirmus]|nr:hypothetical protein BTR23_24140 [Alkalihalophilus pseudofirmus]